MNWVRDQIKKHADDDPDFRQAYVEDALRRRIAHQIRALREAKEWSQKELGERMNKPQGNVSRMEDPAYGKWSLATLFELANTFGVAPFFEFISHEEFVARTEELTNAKLARALFPLRAEQQMDTVAEPDLGTKKDESPAAYLADSILRWHAFLGSKSQRQGEEGDRSELSRRCLLGKRNDVGRDGPSNAYAPRERSRLFQPGLGDHGPRESTFALGL